MIKKVIPFAIDDETIWNKKTQRCRKVAGFKRGQKINLYLNRLALKVESAHDDFLIEHDRHPTKTELLGLVFSDQKNKAKYLDDIILIAMNRKLKTSKHTAASYGQLHKYLLAYQADRERVFMRSVDTSFYFNFLQFLYGIPLQDSSVGLFISKLKHVCVFAQKNYQINTPYTDFKVPKSEAVKIYLTISELNTFYNLKLSGNMAVTRDIFLLACYTGARYGEFKLICQDNIYTDETGSTLEYKSQKGGNTCRVPVSSRVQSILDKYGGKLPDPGINNVFNRRLKQIGKMAGIDSPVIRNITINGKVINKGSQPKFKILSAHTARHSFVTNARLLGIPLDTIQAMVGHTSAEMTSQYNKMTIRQKVAKFLDNDLFR